MLAVKAVALALTVQAAVGFVPVQNKVVRNVNSAPISMSADLGGGEGFGESGAGNSKAGTSLSRTVAAFLAAGSVLGGSMALPVNAADYAPASAPPTLKAQPQVARTPKAVQPGVPEKWIYSKFLDEVEKDHVEKVTFSPDGKKAVATDDDGDRFTVDIPNDPNLLSFLVQHKVEINVAPINASGGTGGGDTQIVLPEGEFDRLLQTFLVPGVLTSAIFLYPAFKILFPTKTEREELKASKNAPPRPGPFGGMGPPRGPGG